MTISPQEAALKKKENKDMNRVPRPGGLQSPIRVLIRISPYEWSLPCPTL